jgi:GNAT superfamily N-acetyltransferase
VIRPTVPDDVPQLVALSVATTVFHPIEIDALGKVLGEYCKPPQPGDSVHRCYTDETDGRIVGYVYFAEADMTDRSWFVWWLAVDPTAQGKGTGRGLLRFAEDEVRHLRGRLLLVETSGTPAYEPTMRFYLKNGYDREAVIRDYFRDGDDKVVSLVSLISQSVDCPDREAGDAVLESTRGRV